MVEVQHTKDNLAEAMLRALSERAEETLHKRYKEEEEVDKLVEIHYIGMVEVLFNFVGNILALDDTDSLLDDTVDFLNSVTNNALAERLKDVADNKIPT
jgi:hypothetical protein